VNYMVASLNNSVSRCLLAGALLFPIFVDAAEPVFVVLGPSVTEELAPEQLPLSFYTFEPEDYWAEPEDSWWLDFSNWVIRQEREHGQSVQALGEWADRTLSGAPRSLPDNESYVRLRFETETRYGNLLEYDPDVRFRLDVPTAEEKLRLIIDSESEDQIPLEERERDRQLTASERSDAEAIGALRYISDFGDAINFSTDIGGRLRLPPEMFWRMKAGKRWQFDQDWGLAVEQRVYYYHTEGWGARSWFGANRSVGNGWHFYASSELEWLHDERKFDAAQIFSVRKRLNNRSVVRPRVGVLGESKPSWRVSSYFADVTWRYRLYEDWFFAELVPALSFPREDDFKDRASVVFRLEMYFSGTINRD